MAVLKAALILVLLATFLGEVIAPEAENLAINGRAIAKSGGQTLTTKQGAWIRFNKQFIYIREVASAKRLEGVTIYQFGDNNKLLSAITAAEGDYQGKLWLLHDAKITDLQGKNIISSERASMPWNVRLDPLSYSVSQMVIRVT